MVVTVATVVYTHDLSIGVLVGVVLSALLFARAVADHAFMELRESTCGREHTYAVMGQLFFVTVTGFLDFFNFQEDVDRVVIDLTASHVWDGSAVAAIDKAVLRYRQRGVEVEVVGLNERSASLLSRLATHDKPGATLAVH
jgi:SulP family sulfate permease